MHKATAMLLEEIIEKEKEELQEFIYRQHQEKLKEVWEATQDYIGICWCRRARKRLHSL